MIKRIIAMSLCAITTLSASAAATVTTVEEGGTLTLNSTYNKDATIIVAAAGSTISLPQWASGDKNKIFYPHLVVSGGVVRVSSSGWTRYRFVSGIRSVNGGSLVVDGAPEITVDRQTVDTNKLMSATGPLCDIDDVTFTASNPKGLLLRFNATVRRLPSTCPVKIESGCNVALACTDANAAAPLLVDNTLYMTNFNVTALNANTLPAGCRVKVSPGCAFMFDAYTLSENGFTLTPASGATGRFNIELLGRGAKVCFANSNSNNIRCESNVTGLGEILFSPNSGTVITRFRGMAYQVSTSSSLSIPVDTANEPAPTESWKSKVSHWFDASDADTIVPFTFDPSSWGGNWANAKNEYNGHQIVIGMKDKVEGSEISLYNSRIWSSGSAAKASDYVLQVMPYLVEGGLNGKSYLCCGLHNVEGTANAKYDASGNLAAAKENRRLDVWTGTDLSGSVKPATGGSGSFSSKYCIMLFGSQQGGGLASLGTVKGNGNLARTGATVNAAWTRYDGFSMHVDGLTKSPKEDTPNGGWQIVSIDMTGTNTLISGIGQHQGGNYGGQNYAEVIFFNEKPTVAERAACERYLAEKWGFEDSYVQWDNASSSLSGSSGNVILYDDARATYDSVEEITAEGSFSGTVLIPAGKTLVIEKPLPPTEADVPDANRVGWFDPDFDGAALSTNELVHTDLLWTLYGRTLDGLCDGADDLMYASGGKEGKPMDVACATNFGPRMVTGVRSALTTGPSRKWLVFKDAYDGLGNTIRSKKVGDGALASATAFHAVKQAFFVTDTSAGGGSVVSDTVNFDGKIKHRVANAPVADPVWASGNSIDITHTWLDTREIDGTATGYSGRPEVLSFTTTANNFTPTYIAWYQGGNAEILGEYIFYSQPLDDAARTKVQEYLMYKWFGDLNGKYADYSGATVTGAGTLKSPTLRNLPQFGQNFTGSVAGGSELSFTIGADGVVDSLAIDSSLVLDDGATVTVNVTGKPAAGHHTLLTATSISGSATPVIVGLPANRTAKLHVDADEIWLEVTAPGMIVIVH